MSGNITGQAYGSFAVRAEISIALEIVLAGLLCRKAYKSCILEANLRIERGLVGIGMSCVNLVGFVVGVLRVEIVRHGEHS